ncbi:MAG TPA: DUF3817 domain-containing protein [Baekduia sp.]|nr:DUF3817 domain-containing protein [Baekduia sp.]
MPTIAPAPPDLRRQLNITLAVGLADALLLVVLVYFAFINRSDTAVHILGPIHGLGFIALLLLTGNGALQKLWGWWFPALVIVTGGPIGSIIGDLALRRGLNQTEHG